VGAAAHGLQFCPSGKGKVSGGLAKGLARQGINPCEPSRSRGAALLPSVCGEKSVLARALKGHGSGFERKPPQIVERIGAQATDGTFEESAPKLGSRNGASGQSIILL
jgi:hypothetical protein